MWPVFLVTLGALAIWLRPKRATEARPTYRLLGCGLLLIVAIPLVVADPPWTPAKIGIVSTVALLGVIALLQWWNACFTLVGRWCERRDLLGRVVARGYIKWASAKFDPMNRRYRRIYVTLADDAFVDVDGEWRNARLLYEAMLEAKCASEPWPERLTLFG